MSIEPFLRAAAGAALATFGFAILFNTPRRALLFVTLVGVAGQLAHQFVRESGGSPELAAFMGGLVVGLLAEVGARLYRTPATVFTITGFIALVPGTLAFRGVKAFLDNEVLAGVIFLVRTGIIGGAIAAGLGVVAAIAQLRRRRAG